MIEKGMFYKATPKIIEYAQWLRNNMTHQEILLWEKLRKKQLGVRFRLQHLINRSIDFS